MFACLFMKNLIFLFYLTLSVDGLLAQSYFIKIKLTDAETKNIVENAGVDLSRKYFSTSNNAGEIIFDEIPKGEYSLYISHIGYKVFNDIISVYSDTSLVIQLNPIKIRLSEVIVTSSKYEKDIKEIPYAVSIIDESFIKKNPSITIADLLKNESGISLLRDGVWGTEVSIRGLNRSNIVTLIDGNRMETSTDISARLSMIDLYDIEKIEVIKGAASSLYGTGATGGIINIISKTGSYDSNFEVRANYNAGFNSVNDLFANGLNFFASDEKWLLKFSGSYRNAGNTKTPSGELSNSQFEDNSISSLIQYKPFDDHEIKLSFQRFKALDVGIPGAAPLFPNNAKVTYPQEERQLYSAEYKVNNLSKEFVKLTAKYFHQFISREVENIPGTVQLIPAGNGQPPRRVSVLTIKPEADHKVDGFQSQADFSFADHYIIAGFDFWKRNYNGLRTRDQKIEILNSADSSVVRTTFKTTFEKPLPNANYYSAGFYLHDEIKLMNDFNLTLGGRYDFIWLNNERTLNPLYEVNDGVVNNTPTGQKVIWESKSAKNRSYNFNIGLVYSFNDISNISFSAARSFRSPSLEERYQYIDLGSLIRIGDPNLKPEQGYFFDLGYKIFTDDLNLTTNFFYNTLKDLLAEVPGIYDNRNALIKVNIGEAILYGFELSADYSLVNELKLYNTISYVRGINQKDDMDLPQISPLNGILGLRYYPFEWLETDLSAVAFGRQNKIAAGEKETPGYVYFNLSFNIPNLIIGKVKSGFTVGIENIFNKEYMNHLSTNRGLIISEPGRNFYIRTNLAF